LNIHWAPASAISGLAFGFADGEEAGDGGVACVGGGVSVFFELGRVEAELAGNFGVGGVGVHQDGVALRAGPLDG